MAFYQKCQVKRVLFTKRVELTFSICNTKYSHNKQWSNKMATTDNNIQYDLVFFDEFFHKLDLGFSKTQHKAVKELLTLGLLQRDRLMEMAVSKVSGVAMDSGIGKDLANGGDIKTAVLSSRNNHKKKGIWTSSFNIHNIATKVGDLYVIVYNKVLSKFHYFRIPYDSYRHLTTVLEIILERYTIDPASKSTPVWSGINNVKCKWWQYEVESFDEMCED